MSPLGLSTQQPLFLSTLMCTMGAGDPNSGPCAYTGTEPPLQSLKGFFKKICCWERKSSQLGQVCPLPTARKLDVAPGSTSCAARGWAGVCGFSAPSEGAR